MRHAFSKAKGPVSLYRKFRSQPNGRRYLRHVAGDKYEPLSAGVDPAKLNPLAVEAMQEIGIDISRHTSKDVRSFLGTHIPYVITVCDNARERSSFYRNSQIGYDLVD